MMEDQGKNQETDHAMIESLVHSHIVRKQKEIEERLFEIELLKKAIAMIKGDFGPNAKTTVEKSPSDYPHEEDLLSKLRYCFFKKNEILKVSELQREINKVEGETVAEKTLHHFSQRMQTFKQLSEFATVKIDNSRRKTYYILPEWIDIGKRGVITMKAEHKNKLNKLLKGGVTEQRLKFEYIQKQ